MVDARIVRTKQRIRATLVAMLQDRDLEDVTIREISAASGVAYSSFYRHYATKQELIAEIARLEVQDLTERAIPMMLSETMSGICLYAARHIHARRDLWRALTSGTAAAILREQFIAESLEQARKRSGFYFGSGFLPRQVTASLTATILVEMLSWWLRLGDASSPEYFAEVIERVILKPALESW